jgi:SAM-dependent methyltransferase
MRNVEATIAQKYNRRFTKLGAVPEASLWFSRERQLARFKLIADVVAQKRPPANFSINDIGCGYGAFLPYLFQRFPDEDFKYTGFEIAEKPLNYCIKTYQTSNVVFKMGSSPKSHSDFSVMSGTYNYAPVLSPKVWQAYLFKNLSQIWSYCRCGIIFNLSVASEAKITSQNISYFSQKNVIKFCQTELGKTSLSFSDNLPKEATFSVFRS